MQEWSDSPVHEDFSVKFYLDTNLLIFLVDESYQSLNNFIDLLQASPFCRLVSSKYAIFEFVGVRKKEHYFRIAASNSERTPQGNINFSSLYKYRDHFNNPDAVFEDEIAGIQERVNEEIEKISTEFGIDFEYSTLHSNLLNPTFNVCLSSKISNHDSLVLVSAVLPQLMETEPVVLLTNDSDFVSSFESADVSTILHSSAIKSPKLINVNSFNGIQLATRNGPSREDLEARIPTVIIDQIKSNRSEEYLGVTFVPAGENFPDNCICFNLRRDKELINNKHITIIGQNLDFIITSRMPVSFWNNGNQVQDGFEAENDNSHISCRFQDIDDNQNSCDFPQEIIVAIRQPGNLVFIHPDST